jgi:hypothetical protein
MDPILERELRVQAMSFAIQYCATHGFEDLLPVAEQIYQFLTKQGQ